MTPENIKNKRLFCLFLLGCLIFNYPIISLFNHEIFIFGIPLLFVFLFCAWAWVIIAMVFITRIHPKMQHKQTDAPKSHEKEPGFPYTSDKGPPC
jgi:TRAP-type C4-dicarboxylate transport system permease small subunit